MNYKTTKGYLALELGAIADDCVECEEEAYTFTTEAGNVLDVCFDTEKQAEATPLNTLIVLSLALQDDGTYHVSPNPPWFTKLETELPAPSTVMNVAIFKTVHEDRLPGKEEEELVKVNKAAAYVQRRLRQISGKFWHVDVRGFVLPLLKGEAPPDRSQWCTDAIKRYREAHPEEFEDFEPTKCHLWGNVSSDYCGWGQVGGKYSMTFSTCGTRTMLHELGHNFGLRHSTSAGNEYGDTSCWMGKGNSGFNSPQQHKLEIDTERETIYVNKSVELLLMPISYSQDDLVARSYQHVIVPRGSRKYYISTYASQSYVQVHLAGPKPDRIHQLKVDGEVTIEDFTVQVLERRHGIWKVRIVLPDNIEPLPVEIPETLPAKQEGTTIGPEHHGTWWDSRMSGQGFDLQHGKYLFWYAFDDTKLMGQPFPSRRFFISVIDESEIEFPIYTTENGTLEDPSIREETLVGYGQLGFFDNDSGLFRYRFLEDRYGKAVRGSIRLERLTWTDRPESGTFWNAERDGEGFSIQFLGDAIAAFWYTYGPPDRDHIGRIVDGNSTQRWYIMTGRPESDNTWPVEVQEMQGGYLNEQIEATPHVVGEGVLKWTGEGWSFSYSISQGNAVKKGTLFVDRIP